MNQSSPPTKRSILSSALLMSVIVMGSIPGFDPRAGARTLFGYKLCFRCLWQGFSDPESTAPTRCRRRDDLRLYSYFSHRPEAIRGDEAAWTFTRRFFNLQIWVLSVIVFLGVLFREELVLAFAAIGGRVPEPELAY